MVEINVIENDKKKNTMSFILKNATPAFANSLRRTIINRVPTMAIEDVEFVNNSSILYDEIVAHRLGLIPLTTDLSTYNLKETCKCNGEGCARCTVQMSMVSKGSGLMMSGLIKSKDPKVIPVYPDMPIVKLIKGQELEFTATAELGMGKNHAKWSPGNVWYVYNPKITLNQKSKEFDECKDRYPKEIFDSNGKIDPKRINKPHLVDACDGVCEDVIKIEYDDTSFLFYLESWGQISCKEMLEKALEILQSDIDGFAKALKSAE